MSPDVMERWSELGCETLAIHAINGAHMFHQAAHEQFSEVFGSIARAE